MPLESFFLKEWFISPQFLKGMYVSSIYIFLKIIGLDPLTSPPFPDPLLLTVIIIKTSIHAIVKKVI